MEIIGQSVKNKKYGLGKITKFISDRISVKFDSKPEEIDFVFPDAFDKHLMFTDTSLQNQVKALIAGRNAAKERERAAQQQPATVRTTTQRQTTARTSRANIPSQQKPASRINNFSDTNIPSSAIMLAKVYGKSKHYNILIVRDDKQQQSSKGIYWKGRTLSKAIMVAHFSGSDSFTFDGVRYTIDTVIQYVHYSAEKRKWTRFNSITEAKELYVFKQKGIYDNPENGYELVDAKLYFPHKREAIKVTVYYEEASSRFFMNEETFIPLVKAHGLPNVELHFTDDVSNKTGWMGSFNEQSKLKMLGYNVQQADGMSDGERQRLLYSIISSGLMNDVEVVNHLEMLIHLNSGKPNMYNACGCWKADLQYVYNNFGGARKKKDFYGSTAKKTGRSTGSGKPAQFSSTYARPNAPYSTAQHEPSYIRPQYDNSVDLNAARKAALIEKRNKLNTELAEATGLFNIFRRMRIKRELREVDSGLNNEY